MLLKVQGYDGRIVIAENISDFSEYPCSFNKNGKYECEECIDGGEHDTPFKFVIYKDENGDKAAARIFAKSYVCSDDGKTIHVIDPASGILFNDKEIDDRALDSYLSDKTAISIEGALKDFFGVGATHLEDAARDLIAGLEKRGWVASGRAPYSRWFNYRKEG